MIIFGENGFIGRNLKDQVAQMEGVLVYLFGRSDGGVLVYLFGRSDGNSKEELFRQVDTLNGMYDDGSRIIYSSSAYIGHLNNYYTLTKEYTEHYFRNWNSTGLRFCNIYGEGGKGIINKLLNAAKTGDKVTINDPFVAREFMHVDDAVRWILIAANSSEKIIEAGSGERINMHNLVELVESITDTKLNIDYNKTFEEPSEVFCSEKIGSPIKLANGIESLWKR
jgi:nucleoside-diphosphate-sugar epimerase